MPTRRKRSSAKSTTAQRIAAAIDKKPAETSVAKKKPVARKKPVVKEEVVVVSSAVTKEKIEEWSSCKRTNGCCKLTLGGKCGQEVHQEKYGVIGFNSGRNDWFSERSREI